MAGLLLESGDSLLLESGGTLLLDAAQSPAAPTTPPPITFLYDGNPVQVSPGSFSIDDTIDERAVASFTIIDADRTITPVKGRTVTITTGETTVDGTALVDDDGITVDATNVMVDDEGTGVASPAQTLFSGYVERSRTSALPGGLLFHEIDAVDQVYLADKRLAAVAYQGQTVH